MVLSSAAADFFSRSGGLPPGTNPSVLVYAMPTDNTLPYPYFTLKGLHHIHKEVDAAYREMREMLAIGGDIRAIWNKPRKYFEPEDGTHVPVPTEELSRLLRPTWGVGDFADPVRRALLADIFAIRQFFDCTRDDIALYRFKARRP